MYLRHNFPWTAFVDILRVLNQHPDAKYKYPDSQYKVLQQIGKYDTIEFGECLKCDSMSEIIPNNDNCPVCGKKLSRENLIIYIPLKQQIKAELKKNAGIIRFGANRDGNNICDITNGSMYSSAGQKELIFTMNTDGARIYESGSKSLWPIYLAQNYLPAEVRYKSENLILVALHYGGKPNMNRYLLPLVDEMNELLQSGVHMEINGKQECFVPYITSCVCDLPAKHMLTHIKYYNGYYACTICEQEGEKCGNVVRYTNLHGCTNSRRYEKLKNKQRSARDVRHGENA